MNKVVVLVTGALLLGTAAASAEDFRSLSQSCEEALALSALPAALRDRANVYVWQDGDFAQTIRSDGGFHCVVQRNHRDAIIPECVTSTGKDSILEGIFAQTRMVARGMGPEEAAAKTTAMIENGEIGSPQEPGVNYMMSGYNLIYTAQSDSVGHFPPHTMFFAPHATNDVVGGDFQMARATHGFPFVVEAGSHSYIVAFTNNTAETDDVEERCRGQIDVTPFSVASD